VVAIHHLSYTQRLKKSSTTPSIHRSSGFHSPTLFEIGMRDFSWRYIIADYVRALSLAAFQL
jgi:hypothetical protein